MAAVPLPLEAAAQRLQTLLDSADPPTSILVLGPAKSGKTALARSQPFENHQVARLSYEDFRTHKDLEEYVDQYLNTRNIVQLLSGKAKLLFFDDIEILFALNRYASAYIQKLAVKKWPKTVIVFACNSLEERRVTDLKRKVSCVVNLAPPPTQDAPTLESKLLSDNVLELASTLVEHDAVSMDSMLECVLKEPCIMPFVFYENCRRALATKSAALDTLLCAYANTAEMETQSYLKNDAHLAEMCILYRCALAKHLCVCNRCKCNVIKYPKTIVQTSAHYVAHKKNAMRAAGLDVDIRDVLANATSAR